MDHVGGTAKPARHHWTFEENSLVVGEIDSGINTGKFTGVETACDSLAGVLNDILHLNFSPEAYYGRYYAARDTLSKIRGTKVKPEVHKGPDEFIMMIPSVSQEGVYKTEYAKDSTELSSKLEAVALQRGKLPERIIFYQRVSLNLKVSVEFSKEAPVTTD